jgi:kumamolisin
VCIAAGDDGSDDQVGDGAAHVDFPSTSPYVLCVGGTALQKSDGSGFTETTWFDGDGLRADGGGSTGGGVSEVITRPIWQKNIAIASVNPHAPAGRLVPDVPPTRPVAPATSWCRRATRRSPAAPARLRRCGPRSSRG